MRQEPEDLAWRPVFVKEDGSLDFEPSKEHLTDLVKRTRLRATVQLTATGELTVASRARFDRQGLREMLPTGGPPVAGVKEWERRCRAGLRDFALSCGRGPAWREQLEQRLREHRRASAQDRFSSCDIQDGNSSQQVCQHCGHPGGPAQFGLAFCSTRCGRRVHSICVAGHHAICEDCIGGGATQDEEFDRECYEGGGLAKVESANHGNTMQPLCQHCGHPGGGQSRLSALVSARCGRSVHRICAAEHYSSCDGCQRGGGPPVPVPPTTGGLNQAGTLFSRTSQVSPLQWLDFGMPEDVDPVCEVCLTFARVPYRDCSFCGARPSHHHGRCCEKAPDWARRWEVESNVGEAPGESRHAQGR